MKTAYQKFVRVLSIIIGCLALMVVLNSCNKDQEQVTPNLKTESINSAKIGTSSVPLDGCPTNYHWDNQRGLCVPDVDPCDAASYAAVDASQRAKAVRLYGQNGGQDYDTAKREVTATPSLTFIGVTQTVFYSL